MEDFSLKKKTLYKCNGCGGNMFYSPQNKSLICDNCGSLSPLKFEKTYTKHDVHNTNTKSQEYLKWVSENKVFKCDNCGAQIILSGYEISAKCPYCNSSVVMDNSEISGIQPDGVIPFEFEKDIAGNYFLEGIKKKWFVPNKFKKKLPSDDINGLYVPCFSFDAKSKSTYKGVLVKRESRRGMDGKTEHYNRYINISGNIDVTHIDVLIETSSQIQQKELKDILPYDIGGKVNYADGFIRGYSVEHYNEPLETCYNSAKVLMDNEIRSKILQKYDYTYVQALNVNSAFSDENFDYVLMPLYRFNYIYNNKNYATIMNGQTGKLGGGVPRSKIKITFFVIAMILLGFGIAILAMFLEGIGFID